MWQLMGEYGSWADVQVLCQAPPYVTLAAGTFSRYARSCKASVRKGTIEGAVLHCIWGVLACFYLQI
jgi:hypothetical protein